MELVQPSKFFSVGEKALAPSSTSRDLARTVVVVV